MATPKNPWRPIKTAPKDGSEVLVWCQSWALVPLAAHFTSRAYLQREYGDPDYMEEGWYLSYSYPDGMPEATMEPSHWMPMPPEPINQGERNGD